METWIKLNSNNVSDALALASVISNTNNVYHIVRKSIYSIFFKGLKNVIIGFYKKSDDSLLHVIDTIESTSWNEKCKAIAESLGINIQSHYSPYLGFCKKNKNIENIIGNDKCILLYLFPHQEQNLNLMIVDDLTKIYRQKEILTVSGGTSLMPCIRGTKDLRQIISIPVLIGIRDKIKFIITSEEHIKTIGEAIGTNVYVISDSNGLMIDGHPVTDASQIANYISILDKN